MFIKLSQGSVQRRGRWTMMNTVDVSSWTSNMCVLPAVFNISHLPYKAGTNCKIWLTFAENPEKVSQVFGGKTITASLDLGLFAQYLPRWLGEINSILSIRTISPEFGGTRREAGSRGPEKKWINQRKDERVDPGRNINTTNNNNTEDQGWLGYEL